jgi:tRNA A-37 threonylcarbamoyl transferase component Bud32
MHMNNEQRLRELTMRWNELRQQGQPVSTEALCADCPDLLQPLQQHLQALQAMEAFLDLNAPEGTPPAPERATVDFRPDVTPEDKAAPPIHIPGYEILQKVGQGGVGVVYKARYLGLKRTVALKMLRTDKPWGEQHLARFRAEAEAIARLQDPNIVQIFDIGERDGQPYLSLEFVDGGSLARKLRDGPLSPHDAARLLETLARAVHAVHQCDIIHRDLKPGNILLTRDGVPKISDFGLAKLLAGSEGEPGEVVQTQPGAIAGTPSYMAPEQAEGKTKEVGPTTDVYALGGIFYEVLTGKPPFQAATMLDTLIKVVAEEPTPPSTLRPEVPTELEIICLKCLRKPITERYASAAELAEELRRFLNGEAIHTAPTLVRSQRQAWRWRWPMAAAVLCGLTALLALVFFLNRPAAPAPGPLTGELIVRVWTPGEGSGKRGLRVDEGGALPVHEGDWVQVQARLSQPAYIYLLWLDGQGEVIPLYPWHDDLLEFVHDVKVPPPNQQLRTEVLSPYLKGKGWRIDDKKGLETVLLLARRGTPLPPERSLAKLIGKPGPAPFRDPLELAVRGLDRGRPLEVILDRDRGLGKKAQEIDEPLVQLMERLQDDFELIRAVRFAHDGK